MQSSKLKIFLDSAPLTGGHAVRGIGSYTRNLLDALKRRNDLDFTQEKKQADIIHYPYFDFFYPTLKIQGGEKVAVTVYDTIPLIYPKYYPAGFRGGFNFFRQRRQLKKAKAIITISETSKKDIVRFLDIGQEKIFPIHLAPSDRFRKMEDARPASLGEAGGKWKMEITKRYGLSKRFVLYVGDVNYNKNVAGLIKAFALLANDSELKRIDAKVLKLVLVGKAFRDDIDEARQILQQIKELGLEDRVVITGYVEEEDLIAIYNLASIYCQPSFYEGFGLPVLEAMASSTPVVAAKTQALVEVASGAAYFVDPRNPEAIAGGLKQVFDKRELRNELRNKGLRKFKNFSWDKVADETVAIYKKVADS